MDGEKSIKGTRGDKLKKVGGGLQVLLELVHMP